MEGRGRLHSPIALVPNRAADIDWIWSRVDPRGSLDAAVKRILSKLLLVFKPLPSNLYAVTFLTDGSRRYVCAYILSLIGMTYKTNFGLHDWIYWTLYIHTTRYYRQYSAIFDLHTLQFTVTHALGFSVFTNHILATDLSQSHCNFKSHVKSSLHRLIPFLLFLLNHLRLPSPELDPIFFLPDCFTSLLLFCTSQRPSLSLNSPIGLDPTENAVFSC
jgi:hypothetical protein